NFPNPFNPSTVINYSLAKEAFVKLAVYNAIGQEVVTLVNGVQPVGAHKVTFNASSFNSGVYFYRIETADFTAMRKMLLVK
ncbi:MAG: T9SS type A sorting domain-containing protein, partial [Ignavibacteria bacterium]|nr:T9SS type A sorting domain-containing protein [Ignavibacteria bacterium]